MLSADVCFAPSGVLFLENDLLREKLALFKVTLIGYNILRLSTSTCLKASCVSFPITSPISVMHITPSKVASPP